jgi:hypothetical protein
MTWHLSKFLAFSSFAALAGLLPPGAAQAQDCGTNNLVPESEFCLTGTTVIGSGGMAVFKAKNQTQSVGAGEKIGDWRITAITPDGVTIQRGTVNRKLELNAMSVASRPVSRPAGQPRQLHNVSPVAAGKAASVGTSGPGPQLSISTHLPPVEDY